MLALVLLSLAHAVPLSLTHQGRLLDAAGGPLNGTYDLELRLLDDTGAEVWATTLPARVEDGTYAVRLTLPSAGLLDRAASLAVGVAGAGTLGPAQPLSSVPFSVRADTSTNLVGGTVDASAIRVDGLDVVAGNGVLAARALPAAALTEAEAAAAYLRLTGGNLTGALDVAGNDVITADGLLADRALPAAALTEAEAAAAYLRLSGGTVTGNLTVNGNLRGTQTHYFHGATATPTEWQADVIFNGNYRRFCEALGQTYVSATTLQEHYHVGKGTGYFYAGWYYTGTRFCSNDTHVWGNGTASNPYNVWRYSGSCGCCPERGSGSSDMWSFERSALITCR